MRRGGPSGLNVIAVPWIAAGVLVSPVWADEQRSHRPPTVEGLRLEAYADGRWQGSVQAARGYADTKRWGFLQTALIPTLELEEVEAERAHADGTVERVRVPEAVLELGSKEIYAPSGDLLFGRRRSVETGPPRPLRERESGDVRHCRVRREGQRG